MARDSISKVLLARSAVQGILPTINEIDLGEIAINTHDGKAFLKRNADGDISIVTIGEGAVDNVYYVAKNGRRGAAGTSLQDPFATIDSAVSVITPLSTFNFDEARCSRDLGYIIDGLVLDITLGTNYNAVTSGLAYQRAGSVVVKQSQLVPTRNSFQEAKGAVASIPAVKASTGIGGALYRNNAHWSEIIDILVNGATSVETAADVLLYPAPVVVPFATSQSLPTVTYTSTAMDDANVALQILRSNREQLKSEGIAYISANYPGLDYNEIKCRRDIGFIIDSICFDIQYGGNHATQLSSRAYFVDWPIGTVTAQLGAGTTTASVATYTHLGLVMSDLVQNVYSNLITDDASFNQTGVSGSYATAVEGGQIVDLIAQLSYTLSNSNSTTVALPTLVNPDLVSLGVSAQLRAAKTAIEDQEALIILQSVKRAKVTGDYTIFLKSGDHTINNPIKLPPKLAIVGDNLRTTTIRPKNVDSDLFYVDNGNFIKDVTFRDHQNFAACVSFDPDVDSPGAGPFIVQSPYVQNCTSITTDGVGMRIDGSKASGLRSMVSDAFTQYNAAGIGVHLLNRGYAQLVSIFTISTQTSILATSGGQCSITNSNSSFGDYGLVATGGSPMIYQGDLDSDKIRFDNVMRVNNITNYDSYSYLEDFGALKRPNYNDCFRFDSENYYYTILGVDSVAPGSYNLTFEPPLNFAKKSGQKVNFHQRSLITSSSHTFEYVGSGTNTFTAIPQNGGIPIQANEVLLDSDASALPNFGLVYFTSTDHLGDFRIGGELTINREEGTITGDTFDRSLFAVLTPYILALEG